MVGLTYALAGKYPEGLQAAQRAVDLDPESYLPRWSCQVVLSFSGRYVEAVAAGQKALAMSGRHPWSMMLLAQTLAESERIPDAESVYAEMIARAHREYIPPSTLAVVASAVARWNEALRHTREAMEIRDPCRIPLLSSYTFGKGLRKCCSIDQMLKKSGIE